MLKPQANAGSITGTAGATMALAKVPGKRDQAMRHTYILEYEINDIPQAHIVTVTETDDQPVESSEVSN